MDMSLDLTSDFLQNKFEMPEASKNGVYTFDRFKLDAEKLMLYRDEAEITLPPKVVKTLAVLIEHRGSILSKDELIERVWADAIVEESNLSQNLYVLRKSLGKKPDGTPYIETFRRRGYRFNGDVQIIEQPYTFSNGTEPQSPRSPVEIERRGNVLRLVDWNQPESQPRLNEGVVQSAARARPRSRGSLIAVAAALIIIVLGGAAFVFYRGVSGSQMADMPPELSVLRLTNGGMPGGATISSDGNYLVYHELVDGGNAQLFLQQVGQPSRLEIASSAEETFHFSTFAPDSRSVYFVASDKSKGKTTLYRVPAIGGPKTKILEDISGPVSFSPTGNEMVFVRSSRSGDRGELIIADSDGKAERILVSEKSPNGLASGTAWSRDGKSIAFSKFAPNETNDGITGRILLVDISNGSVKELSGERWSTVFRMEWTNDGKGLILVGTRAKEAYSTRRDQVYLISYPDGVSRRITSDGNRHEPGSLGVTINGGILAVTGNRSSQVWSMSSNGDQNTSIQLTRGLADGRAGLCTLSDGRFGYISRTGEELSIWLANPDGSGAKELVTTGSPIAEELRCEPNGKFLVFSTVVNGTNRLFRVDIDGNNPKQLTFGEGNEVDSSVSPDGSTVTYGSYRYKNGTPYPALFRVLADGSETLRLGAAECSMPNYSPDGNFVSCIAASNNILVLSASDGAEIKRMELPANAPMIFGAGWIPDSSGLALMVNEKGVSNIWVYPLTKGKPYMLTNFTSGLMYRFAFAPDGNRLYLARGYPTQEAVLITNYR